MMTWAARFRVRQHFRQSLWAVPLPGALAGGALEAVILRVQAMVTLPGACPRAMLMDLEPDRQGIGEPSQAAVPAGPTVA